MFSFIAGTVCINKIEVTRQKLCANKYNFGFV